MQLTKPHEFGEARQSLFFFPFLHFSPNPFQSSYKLTCFSRFPRSVSSASAFHPVFFSCCVTKFQLAQERCRSRLSGSVLLLVLARPVLLSEFHFSHIVFYFRRMRHCCSITLGLFLAFVICHSMASGQ